MKINIRKGLTVGMLLWMSIPSLAKPVFEYHKNSNKSIRLYAFENINNDDYWAQMRAGEIIVRFKQGVDPHSTEIVSLLNNYGAVEILRINDRIIPFVTVKIAANSKESMLSFISAVIQDPNVLYAEPNGIMDTEFIPNDPYWYDQWGPYIIWADYAWDLTLGNMSTSVFVLDQGIDYYHPDLGNYVGGWDFVDWDNDPYPTDTAEHHGTHVSGIVAATIDNSIGIAGMAQIYLAVGRVLNATGGGSWQTVSQGILWAAQNNADVINMSLGGPAPSQIVEEACDSAWYRGCLLVAASGNEGADSISYPARYWSVIAVGALDTTFIKADFSNWGPEMELIAPGVWIVSTVGTWRPIWYDYWPGTSMATPHVSGVAALMKSWNPTIDNIDIRLAMDTTAIDLGSAGWDPYYGYGLVDAYYSLLAVGIKEEEINPERKVNFDVYPNPIKTNALFSYSLDMKTKVNISIYDTQGRLCIVLIDEVQNSGVYTITWNRCDNHNRKLPSGVYFVKLKIQNRTDTKKIIIVD